MNTGFVPLETTAVAAPITPFPRMLDRHGLSLPRTPLEILQVNLTARCNLACTHCHVESGPKREEALDERGIDRRGTGEYRKAAREAPDDDVPPGPPLQPDRIDHAVEERAEEDEERRSGVQRPCRRAH